MFIAPKPSTNYKKNTVSDFNEWKIHGKTQGPLPSEVGPTARGIQHAMSSRRFVRHVVFFRQAAQKLMTWTFCYFLHMGNHNGQNYYLKQTGLKRC